MTLIGKCAHQFPLIHGMLILKGFSYLLKSPGIWSALVLISLIYLLPPALLRVYAAKYPLSPGMWILNHPTRCEWWIAHCLQGLYPVMPIFESILRLIPGVYSAWLRLWGSKVGEKVYWTPNVEILDRHMMAIGDNVIFGHKVICTSHLISKKLNGDLILILRPIKIGKEVFIGAGTRIGPGVKIPDHSIVPYNTEYRFHYDA